MKNGYAKFVSIGRQKEANNQKFSEHTQQRELLELLQLTFSALNYLQDKIQTHIFDGHNEELNKFVFFSRVKTHGKNAELSKGRYEGLLGLILKQHFSETGDIKYLLESKTHFLNAYNAFEADKNVKAAQHVNKCLKEIEELLVTMNNNEVVSMQMK
ncbi:hypothetical protein [uncultured Legionella sp.]|uniref:hypothetical protein n=1 Tax=uncultured Legionella sp. TaxID=210934 RepID=UPI002604961C|nr:hypothetical protein [uncultured Legionella sp.]